MSAYDNRARMAVVDAFTAGADLAEMDAACEHWRQMREPFRRREAEALLGCGNTTLAPSPNRVPTFSGSVRSGWSEPSFDLNLLNGDSQESMRADRTLAGTLQGTKIYLDGVWRNFYGGEETTSPFSPCPHTVPYSPREHSEVSSLVWGRTR